MRVSPQGGIRNGTSRNLLNLGVIDISQPSSDRFIHHLSDIHHIHQLQEDNNDVSLALMLSVRYLLGSHGYTQVDIHQNTYHEGLQDLSESLRYLMFVIEECEAQLEGTSVVLLRNVVSSLGISEPIGGR